MRKNMSEDKFEPITVEVDPRVYDDIKEDPEAIAALNKAVETMKKAAEIANEKGRKLGRKIREDEFNEIVNELMSEEAQPVVAVDFDDLPDEIKEEIKDRKDSPIYKN